MMSRPLHRRSAPAILACVAATQELPVPTEKVDVTPAVRELLKPLEARIAALEKLTKDQQEVIDKLNAAYKKPWSSSAGA
jgi:chaperonin cofactor prefoldin